MSIQDNWVLESHFWTLSSSWAMILDRTSQMYDPDANAWATGVLDSLYFVSKRIYLKLTILFLRGKKKSKYAGVRSLLSRVIFLIKKLPDDLFGKYFHRVELYDFLTQTKRNDFEMSLYWRILISVRQFYDYDITHENEISTGSVQH